MVCGQKINDVTTLKEGDTPLFGLYGGMPLRHGIVFWPCCPEKGINFTCPGSKQGMVLQAERC